ncbi:PrpF domain-containing protein [Streptacidiphilus sp. P02-A3a]|uniref:PrpF domain-containing protein n=1 Tax=Streptacidiphilus sp. P02-A3a TaxID=2704468 RepID=UPI0015F9C448|nr:PrpF domain-containing protein [Streptacidiphilus sp. P02-A3a]QMU71479.1 hypothetical protein GXP74_27835 [Streptacidiphilus sp. P02-A3a]
MTTMVRSGFALLARAAGAPGPTLVLDLNALPTDEAALEAELTRIRLRLRERQADGGLDGLGGPGGAEVLKWALIAPSAHPLFDVDYRFVQAMPDAVDHFDATGNCGHSLLAAVTAAAEAGWLPRLRPGDRIRARVLNNGDQVVCQVDGTPPGPGDDNVVFTAHFVAPPGTTLGQLLRDGGRVVRMANPYLFVDASRFGVRTAEQLFRGEQRDLYAALEGMRREQAARLGWRPDGAFPKVAAVVPVAPGRLAVRALTVGGWHPGLALTGAVCLAAASALEGTVPYRLLRAHGRPLSPGDVLIDIPSGQVAAACAATGESPDDELLWVSVGGKKARTLGRMELLELEADDVR